MNLANVTFYFYRKLDCVVDSTFMEITE